MENNPPSSSSDDKSNETNNNQPVTNQEVTPSPQVVSPTPQIAPTTPNSETPNSSIHQTPSTNKKSNLSKIIFLIIILGLIIAGIGFYLHEHNKKKVQVNVTVKKDIPLIKYAFYNNPLNTFYPSDASAHGTISVQPNLFEGLVTYHNGTQIVPNLASSWTNPNNTTWIFNLKPNIYYHDGNKVTAQDVIYSWHQVQQSPSYSAYLTNTISNVKAINDNTVEIDTTTPDAILLNRLSQLYILDSKAPKNTNAWELGTGPYTVKQGTTPSNNNLDLVAYNNWHGGHAYTREIQFTFVADPGQAAKDLQNGSANLVDGLDYSTLSNSIKQNYSVFQTPQIGTNIVAFSIHDATSSSPVSNMKVREAFAMAVNAADVLNNSKQVGQVANQVVPQTIPGYNPEIKNINQSIQQASQLLAEAGYKNGVTITLGVGEPIASVAQEIAKEVKPAGINLDIKVATDEGTYINDLNNGTYQAFVVEIPSSVLDGSDMLGVFQDQPYYTNATFDSQLNKATSTFDPTQRLNDLQAASLTLYQDWAYIPLYQLSNLNASDKGFVFPLVNYDGDLNTNFANVYQK